LSDARSFTSARLPARKHEHNARSQNTPISTRTCHTANDGQLRRVARHQLEDAHLSTSGRSGPFEPIAFSRGSLPSFFSSCARQADARLRLCQESEGSAASAAARHTHAAGPRHDRHAPHQRQAGAGARTAAVEGTQTHLDLDGAPRDHEHDCALRENLHTNEAQQGK
jgi:hypothetical protein